MDKILLVLLFIGVIVLVSGQNSTNRIVGGEATTISQHKYIVQLIWTGWVICGGTLVSTRHVVSAAHCVEFGESVNEFEVVGGSSYIDRGGVWGYVSRIWMHPKYNPYTMNADIAVLKLTAPLTGSNIKPIGLCNVNLVAGKIATISGWGDTKEGGSSPNQLRSVKIPLVSKQSCNKAYSGGITAGMICAKKSGKDSCQGDSGGPVIINNQLCGVVSWGEGCARPKYPGVYANVKFFKQFVKTHMKK